MLVYNNFSFFSPFPSRKGKGTTSGSLVALNTYIDRDYKQAQVKEGEEAGKSNAAEENNMPVATPFVLSLPLFFFPSTQSPLELEKAECSVVVLMNLLFSVE